MVYRLRSFLSKSEDAVPGKMSQEEERPAKAALATSLETPPS